MKHTRTHRNRVQHTAITHYNNAVGQLVNRTITRNSAAVIRANAAALHLSVEDYLATVLVPQIANDAPTLVLLIRAIAYLGVEEAAEAADQGPL